jgi:hypothetical protein
MPARDDDATKPLEANIPMAVPVRALTNFQLLPENGGYSLIFGGRRFQFTEDAQVPKYETEVFCVAFLSHSMAKDLGNVLTQAISHFESLFGHIPLPGVDQPKLQSGDFEK